MQGDSIQPRWLALLTPAATMSALGVLAFPAIAVMLWVVGVHGERRDVILFAVGTMLLPAFCAAAIVWWVRPDYPSPTASRVEALLAAAATSLLFALALAPLMFQVGAVGARLRRRFVAVAALPGNGKFDWRKRAVHVPAFAVAFALACAMLFRIDPLDSHVNFIVGLFAAPPFSESPAPFALGPALALAIVVVTGIALLLAGEALLIRRDDRSLRRWRLGALTAALIGTLLFFDFSLTSDTFHYMMNVAPALHVLAGGTPMIDVFSQYGPGPVMATVAGFLIGDVTFGWAQLTVQCLNLAYYALWLVCLFRMTRFKFASLCAGFVVIAWFLAAWAHGYGNANDAPSVLGMTYLPSVAMVLALSCLRPWQRHSTFTAFSTFAAALWSGETLIGTFAIHAGFLLLVGARDRAFGRILIDWLRAIVPAVVAQLVVVALTLARAGALPDYRATVDYLFTYNTLRWTWAVVASPRFYGWIPLLLAVFLVFGDAWTRIFDRSRLVVPVSDEHLFYRFVPMAFLLTLQASYFVARSIDYTLLMALLPFAAIAIPAALDVAQASWAARGCGRLIAAIPAGAGLWIVTFAAMSLLRPHYSVLVRPCPDHARCASAAYSLLLHECRDHGRCSPDAIFRGLKATLAARPGIERVGTTRSDFWFDTSGIARDSIQLMGKWAPSDRTVTVLLTGSHNDDYLANEIALMYARKWHRWPRSFVFSDVIVPSLAERIVNADITLREGELVLARHDKAFADSIDAAIFRKLTAHTTLCRLPSSSTVVDAYRVAGPDGCGTD